MTRESYMIEEMTKDMVRLLREEQGLSLEDALRCVYTSDTYDKLVNLNTGLYYQSTAYIYSLLMQEKNLSSTKKATLFHNQKECVHLL